MSKITTIKIRCPIWKAGKIRDKITPLMFGSKGQLTVSESWTIRRPLTWEFTIIGPQFQAHKAAGDVGATGEVFYHAIPACLLLAAAMTVPLPTAAQAQVYEKNIVYSLPAGKTFAVRSLCQDYGPSLVVHLTSDRLAMLNHNAAACVNGRTGVSFTVPPGAATQFITLQVLWKFPQTYDWKVRLDPDCDNGPLTSCVLVGGSNPATTTGRFTWGGDADWIRLDESHSLNLDNIWITTAKNTCVAVGDVVTINDVRYLVVNGGPAGCTYTVTAREQPDI